MATTKGFDFIKKSQQRRLAKSGEIFASASYQKSNYQDVSDRRIWSENVSRPEDLDGDNQAADPSIKHYMTRLDIAKFLLLRTCGNFLILLSLYGVVATFGPAFYYEAQYQIIKTRGIRFNASAQPPGRYETQGENQLVSGPSFADIIAGDKSQVLVPPDTTFSIVIPKLGATAKVWPNIDPLNEREFLPKLQKGVAHAKGSVFPGMQGNVYLFAHSTDNFWDVGRYNAVFYMLKDMRPGDDISLYFENKRYNYIVDYTVIKDANDVGLLVNSQVPGKEQLILQTCWPPGTTWKRFFVIAKPQRVQ